MRCVDALTIGRGSFQSLPGSVASRSALTWELAKVGTVSGASPDLRGPGDLQATACVCGFLWPLSPGLSCPVQRRLVPGTSSALPVCQGWRGLSHRWSPRLTTRPRRLLPAPFCRQGNEGTERWRDCLGPPRRELKSPPLSFHSGHNDMGAW